MNIDFSAYINLTAVLVWLIFGLITAILIYIVSWWNYSVYIRNGNAYFYRPANTINR